jgi:branched-chain amino acid transport system permease protein
VHIGPVFIGQPQLVAGGICLLSFVALWLFVTRTETGLGLQATAQDRQAAAVMGIPTERMSALGWAIGLGCVGVAGTMLSTFFYIFPDVGSNFALLAFVAVALGGFGSILGSLVAGVLIGLVESLGGLLLDPSYKTVIVFALYLAVVIVRPNGLFGRF